MVSTAGSLAHAIVPGPGPSAIGHNAGETQYVVGSAMISGFSLGVVRGGRFGRYVEEGRRRCR